MKLSSDSQRAKKQDNANVGRGGFGNKLKLSLTRLLFHVLVWEDYSYCMEDYYIMLALT